jgi:hypothetical protein
MTFTTANLRPTLEAIIGPTLRFVARGADATGFALTLAGEPIIAHFGCAKDTRGLFQRYTVEEVATIHNGLTPTLFAIPPQWFTRAARPHVANMDTEKQRDYWTTLVATSETLKHDGSTIQLSEQHPFAQHTGIARLKVVKNRVQLTSNHSKHPRERTPTGIMLALTRDPGKIISWHTPPARRKKTRATSNTTDVWTL